MKIATFNVNGITARLPSLLRWLDDSRPDVACLQELKTPQERFPEAAIREAGYGVIWHGQKLADSEWKDVFTAALKRQKVVPGIDGGFVVLGTSTRNMTIAEMGELMELMEAFGAEHNVRFRAPAEYENLQGLR